ncbi:MAG: hypothetical protein WC858_05800 [Parcubacteria group bacterium]|jgi:hypothetical protein
MSRSLEKNDRLERPRQQEQIARPVLPETGQENNPVAVINTAENLLQEFEQRGKELRQELAETVETAGVAGRQASFNSRMNGFTGKAREVFRNFVLAIVAAGMLSVGAESAHAAVFHEEKAPTSNGQLLNEPEGITAFLKKKYGATSDFFHDVNLAIEGAKLFVKMEYYVKTRKGDKMSAEEIEFRERIAQNVSNKSYDTISPLSRTIDFLKDERPYSKEKTKECDIWQRVRVDMFRKYLGLEPFGDFLEESRYRPGKSQNENARYFAFKTEDLLNNIKKNWNREVSGDMQDFENFAKEADPGISHDHFGNVINGDYLGHLGTFKMETGFDEERKERFISYYDKWDLESPQLKSFGINLDSLNFPYEIYGRIYESDLKKAQ